MANIICNIHINGIPTTKYQCFVLCLKRYIPAKVPMLPPSRLTRNKVFSGILYLCFMAFLLSINITNTPAIFMIIR